MYYVKAPAYIKVLYSRHLIWNIPNNENKLFLTFDDGPVPEVTNEVLSILDNFNIKATFFCLGDNAMKYPDTYKLIHENGHQRGCHGFNHVSGWKISSDDYLRNIRQCSEFIDSKLFRPPYGRIKRSQIKLLRDDYKIIMWSVLSGDFDNSVSKEKCLINVIKHSKSGSIIVFHDSLKAKERLLYALPRAIKILLEKGFTFDLIK